MAEGVLFNIAGGIINSLGAPLVAEEIKLLLGAKDELDGLKDSVSTIKAVLLGAEEQQSKSDEVSLWLGRLGDVLYEADDLLDAVSTEVLQRKIMTQHKKAKMVRIFFSKSNQLAFRHKMGHKVKMIRKRLDAIKADRSLHLEERPVETPVRITGRDTHSFVSEQQVIGRENDKEEVIKTLLCKVVEKENVDVPVLPIVGIGGIGKTTLAQLVFNDERIQKNFELKIWVSVSDNFNLKVIVEKILEDALKKKPKVVEMNTLVFHLRTEVVTKKKFFLVLDDVWNEVFDKWLELKKLFVDSIVGSRIMLTTRSNVVAEITHTFNPYHLKGLGEDASWILFKRMACKNGQEIESLKVVDILRKVVKHCVGVPLALGIMGRMSYLKDLERDWLEFEKNILPHISQNDDIMSTLKLSYNKLSPPLKHCFAYCSLFPKGFEFEKSFLIKIWIAQDFVEFQGNRCLEDIGHDYLMELVSRLFFEEINNRLYDENIYKMHDLMHDLARQVARSSITSPFGRERGDDIGRPRHLFVSDDNDFPSLYEASSIRTLICFKHEMDFENIISSFKMLRVLVFKERNINCVPSYISKLKHLRYLDISRNVKIKKLPNSITRLLNLQTLILSGCKRLEKLPSDIEKLVNLRHLDNSNCNLKHMPHGIGQLTSLQTLTFFVVNSLSPSMHKARFDDLNALKNLRGKLKLYDCDNWIRGAASESRKVMDTKVKSAFNVMEFECLPTNDSLLPQRQKVDDLTFRKYQSSSPLSYLSSITSLVELRINSVKCKDLPPLCQLPILEEVYLTKMDHLESISACSDMKHLSSSTVLVRCFPSLKSLKIDTCLNFKGWIWNDSHSEEKANNDSSTIKHHLPVMFSCLSELSIVRCPMLTSMPVFPNLNLLCMRYANWKPLKQTVMLNTETAIASSTSASSSLTPFLGLKHLELGSVLDCETLSMEGLQYLPSLQFLEIHTLDTFKSLCLGSQHLTTLKELHLCNCKELTFVNDKNVVQWQSLKSLISLKFFSLPDLVYLPTPLQHFTILQKLYIGDCKNLTTIPEWICCYKLLEELEIVGCPKLTSLPEGVRRFTSLRSLTIKDCPMELKSCKGDSRIELTNDEDGVQWQGPKNLHYICFEKLPLESLPLWFQHATTLQKLYIKNCTKLSSIPKWVCSYKSLEELEIIGCSNLDSPPKELEKLPSLKKLEIEGHPIALQSNKERLLDKLLEAKGITNEVILNVDFDTQMNYLKPEDGYPDQPLPPK